ncbi:MAG: acyl-CoA thioesterase [Candidatus Pacearchaeota archaeon]
MALEILLPETIHFQTELKTRFSDSRSALVASGIVVSHVTYENIALIINEVFDLFLENLGYSKANIANSNIIVPSFEITYHAELKANESIQAQVSVTDIGNKSFSLIIILRKQNGDIAVRSRIGLIFFNYKLQKTEPVPEEFKRRFS